MKKISSIVISALLCLCLAGCGASGQTSQSEAAQTAAQESETVSLEDVKFDLYKGEDGSVSQDIFAMDTYMTVKAYGDQAEEAVTASVNEIERLDNLLSTGMQGSEIAQLNDAGGGAVSEDTEYLIGRSLDLYQSTDGTFDIAIYPVMQLWGFPTQDYHVPDDEEIAQALSLADAAQISLDEENHTVSFGKTDMEIDLGGIAKGYTSSRIAEIFSSYGVTSGIVSLGGNVQAIGSKTDGTPWKVGIQDPDDSSAYLGILSLTDKAAITSGGYERYFEEDGKTYHHIIDPATGRPADSGVITSTVISSDGTLADGLSTTLFIMGADKAFAYWRENSQDFDFILEDEDGRLYVSEGIADSFDTDRGMTVVHP